MYMMTSTVPFDMIVDTDLGLWKLIQDRYNKNIFFYEGLINIRDMNHMKYMITSRMDKNPLKVLLKEEYFNSADSLYNQFMEDEYNRILELSTNTAIYDIICRSKGVRDVLRYTILCKTQQEVDEIHKRFKRHNVDVNTILYDDLKEIDVSPYGSLYIKDIDDFFLYNNVGGKNIIIGNYGFNLENGVPNTPLAEQSLLISKLNVVHMIDMYLIDEHILPVG